MTEQLMLPGLNPPTAPKIAVGCETTSGYRYITNLDMYRGSGRVLSVVFRQDWGDDSDYYRPSITLGVRHLNVGEMAFSFGDYTQPASHRYSFDLDAADAANIINEIIRIAALDYIPVNNSELSVLERKVMAGETVTVEDFAPSKDNGWLL